MTGTDLRSRLRAMHTAPAQTARSVNPTRGLTVTRTAYPLPAGLGALDESALRRMGVESAWPSPERVLFLDTETTGLAGGAGTIAFMIGLGYVEDGAFVVEQTTLGDYPDEPEMLKSLLARMADKDALVTFNGRAFDMKLIENRMTMARMRNAYHEPLHLDLLIPARRLWKRRLGTVKLSVLEERVLRRGRADDLPGSEAPKRFFEYLRSGDWALLEPVIKHNRQDVLSLAHLLVELSNAYREPARLTEPEDLLSMGRVLEKRGERAGAIRVFRMAGQPRPATTIRALRFRRAQAEADFRLAWLLKREGAWAEAVAIWRRMAERGQLGALPCIELAKYCEHQSRALDEALAWTRRALALDPNDSQCLKRQARLRRKLHA